ncbi:MAG: hypothetical protein M3447_00195 [Acidobacteriota bacterium]|nr:hypothetical protein [Acidobacteriota bacterium]
MDTLTIVLVVVIILAVGAAIWFYLQKQRTQRLRSRFGPEYARAIREEGDSSHAEKVLEQRQKRVEKLELKPLSVEEREKFVRAWEAEQARFVDEPAIAVDNAHRLVKEVMRVRGYPVTDFEQRVADVSVDHPVVVENYRVAHAIALRREQGNVSTDELREAMIHYRALFADLLHDGGTRPIRELRTEENLRSEHNTKARGMGR